MKQDRRGFLKLFGVTSAAIAVAPSVANAEPTVEVVKSSPANDIGDIEPHSFPSSSFGLRDNLRSRYDVRDEPLWSQLKVERNGMKPVYSLFQDCPGGSGYVTLAETNMVQSGCLPMPNMYCIKKIGFVFSPKTIPELRSAFINRYALQLQLGRRRYWESPMSMAFSVTEPERDEKGCCVFPDSGFVTLEIPLIIESGLFFQFIVGGEPIHPCGDLKAWAVFKGLHAVGIQ